MKKLFLTVVFVFAMISIINANSNFENYGDESTLDDVVVRDCWAEADAAEQEYCGSVGCSFDYWVATMDACYEEEQ